MHDKNLINNSFLYEGTKFGNSFKIKNGPPNAPKLHQTETEI